MAFTRGLTFRHVDRLLRLAKDQQNGIRVGFDDTKYPGRDVTVAQVAGWNEFGTSTNTPERAFMRRAFRRSANKMTLIRMIGRKVVRGEVSLSAALDVVGKSMVKSLRKTIIEFSSPPNAPSTIAGKGSSNPLIDTGFMLRNAKYWKSRNV